MMPTDGRGNAFRAATITYLITIGILLAASFFPEQRLWGLNWYGYFDWPARFLLLLVGVVVPLALARSRWISRIESEKESKGRASFLLVALLVTVVYFLAFYPVTLLVETMLSLPQADAPHDRKDVSSNVAS